MNEEQSIFDLIEKYHQGLLSEEENALVEKRMQTDASFAEYVKVNGLTNELVHSAGLDMLRERMTNDLSVLDQKRTRMKWGIGTGIVAAILISTSTIYFIQNPPEKISTSSDISQEHVSKNNIEDKTNVISESTDKNNTNRNSTLAPTEEKLRTDTINIKDHISPSGTVTAKTDTLVKVKTMPVEEYKNSDQHKSREERQKESHLLFEVMVQATCKGEATGAIIIDQQSISGGTAPYHFYISNSKEESFTKRFSDLEKGNYTITMYDSKANSYSKAVTVPDKNCTSKKSYSFNPDYGEICKISTTESESGSFTIYNRTGIIIFKGNFSGSGSAEWNGTTLQGVIAEVGLYVCIVEYSEGKKEVIEISIVR